ncbi:MAG TPA: ATP-binding cassette domain-containing protein, partial [Herbaspirillum sp.]
MLPDRIAEIPAEVPSVSAESAHAIPSQAILSLSEVTKRFPGVLALDRVSFSLNKGEVHAVCGENGAGKSTLMKIISGVWPPDEGEIIYKEQVCRFASCTAAQDAGIAIIHQELNLIPHLSVAENIFLAR